MKSRFLSISQVVQITLALLFMLMMINSCGVKKSLPTPENRDTLRTKTFSASDYLQNYIVYTYFSNKSKIEITSPQLNQTLMIRNKSIYNQKTHLSIVASLLGMSTEVAQALFTTDSVHAMDKINANYYELDWSMSDYLLRMPLRFEMFQNLLVGNPAFIQTQYLSFTTESGKAIIIQENPPYTQTLYYDTTSKKLEKIHISIAQSSYTLTVLLSDYRTDTNAGIQFATRHDWSITDGHTTHEVNWRHDEYSFNVPVTITFQIPFRYKKASLY